eukprot:6177540-Amphidinium_carterae.1
MHATALRQAAHDDAAFVGELSDQFWDRLAATLEADPVTLRSQSIAGTLVALGYMQRKVFDVAAQWPWQLCEGNLEENLENFLALEECPDVGVTEKIYVLGRS